MNMTLENKLQEIIADKNLLNHPFYQAWSDGTLPAEKLSIYAREYGGFIGTVAKGWEACGDTAIAAEEVEHYDLWKDFGKSIGVNSIDPQIPEVKNLIESCERHYASPVTALGALYAFEVQQPHTSVSKLKGLRDHYKALKADETYFEVHVDDFDEPAQLMEMMNNLSDDDQALAQAACEDISKKLWDALTGVMGDHKCTVN